MPEHITLGIVGAGRMGSGIAEYMAHAGVKVILVDPKEKSLTVALASIKKNISEKIATGEMTQVEGDAVLARITTGNKYDILKPCSLCIEVVLDNESIKKYIHNEILRHISREAILVSNTLVLSIERLSEGKVNPSRFMGVRFDFPPQSTKGVKLIPSSQTSNENILRASDILQSTGRVVSQGKDVEKRRRTSLKSLQRICIAVVMLSLMVITWGMAGVSDASESRTWMWSGLVATYASVMFLFWFFLTTSERILNITKAMTGLASDDLRVVVPDTDKDDEYGDIARIVDVFKMIVSQLDQVSEHAEKEKIAAEERKQSIERCAQDFRLTVSEIVNLVASKAKELKDNAKGLSQGASQTSSLAGLLSTSTDQTNTSIDAVASASAQLSASIVEINRQVEESSRISEQAVSQTHKTDTTISGLRDAVTQIGDVVQLIRSIAEQTNLLALNATIEAARAGEAGKGFAVVAGEVKSLANQTGRATEEIVEKIGAVQSVTQAAVDDIRLIGSIIQRNSEISQIIAKGIRQQDCATHDISQSIQKAVSGTSQVTSSIKQVTSAAEGSSSAAQNVLHTSTTLSEEAQKLEDQINTFLGSVCGH